MKTRLFTICAMMMFIAAVNVIAQTAEKPYALGISFGKNEFWGNAGNALFDFGQEFYPNFGITGRMYANPSLDFSLNADFGKIGFTKEDAEEELFNGDLNLFSLKAHYKFYNGYILKEDCRIGPFITTGLGYLRHFSKDDWKDQAAVVIPVGAGLNFRLTDCWAVQLQSLLNFAMHNPPTHTDYGYTVDDKYFTHSIGLVYRFKSLCKKKERTQPVAVVPVVTEETRRIFQEALQGVQFETAKDVIKPESFPILDQVVRVMQNNPGYKLEINGHTDDQGDDAMNMDLSRRRAESVKKYLVDKGIAETRLKPQGFGETRPVADNATPEGRAKNRRVEFKVY